MKFRNDSNLVMRNNGNNINIFGCQVISYNDSKAKLKPSVKMEYTTFLGDLFKVQTIQINPTYSPTPMDSTLNKNTIPHSPKIWTLLKIWPNKSLKSLHPKTKWQKLIQT